MSSALVLPITAVGVGLVGVTSVPAVTAIVSQLRGGKPKDNFYEDKDGKSTPEAIAAFSNRRSKVVVLVLSALGFLTSGAVSVLSTLHAGADAAALHAWLSTLAWTLILLQATLLTANHSPVKVYDLGFLVFVSSVVTGVILGFQTGEVSHVLKRHDPIVVLRIINIANVVILGISSILIPRRPDVYYRDAKVDQEYTTSLLARMTWAWAWPLLQLASRKGDLDKEDVPQPARFMRAEYLVPHWHSFNFTKKLLWSIIRAYFPQLAAQWSVSAFRCIVGIGPFWSMLNLIQALEQKVPGEPPSPRMWALVFSLSLFTLSEQWLDGWAVYHSFAKIAFPMRSQLAALVFEKSLKRKVVKFAEKGTPSTEVVEVIEVVEEVVAETGTGDGVGQAAEAAEAEQQALVDSQQEPQVEVRTEIVDTVKDQAKGDDGDELKSQQAVVNLVGVDCRRISGFFSMQFIIVASIGKLIVYSGFLIALIGWLPFGAGILAWAFVLPINTYFSRAYFKRSEVLMKTRDEKLAIVNEALLGMRQIKFAALEVQWEKRIMAVRERELKVLWSIFLADTWVMMCWVVSPILLAAVSLATYAILHGNLSPSIAFTSIGVFKGLEITLGALPDLLTSALDSLVSIRRIDDYLKGPEMEEVVSEGPDVAFENASIAWPVDKEVPDEDRFILSGINLSFPAGELSVISGKTGTGKSLLLSALLGEVDLLDGAIYAPPTAPPAERLDHKANAGNWILPGSLAYVSQTPWLESASFRDNILFGLPFDEKRYDTVLEVCALKKDLTILTDGDKTELGANGINLSGGQKWRITLARAIYSRAEILVMDDIFSAVDAHVGRQIFENCIAGDICRGRTRILVTHHVSLVQSHTKYLVELGEGTVMNAGLTSDLAEDGTLQMIKSHQEEEVDVSGEAPTVVNSEDASEAEEVEGGDGAPLAKVASKDAKKFIEEESREKGIVKGRVYSTYFKDSGGWKLWIIVALLYGIFEAGDVGRSWWLRIWTGQSETSSASVNAHSDQGFAPTFSLLQHPMHSNPATINSVDNSGDVWFYLWIYVAISLSIAAIGTLRFFWSFLISIRASRNLFGKILSNIMRTPLRWLDTVPVGRILNRLTADFDVIDQRIAMDMSFMISQLLSLVGVIVAGSLVSFYIIPLALVLLVCAGLLGKKYLDGARPMKRLESVAKSPVFELFNSTLAGMTTVRSFQKVQTYVTRMDANFDLWACVACFMWLMNRWMGIRMSAIGCTFTTCIGLIVINGAGIDAAMAGFTLSFAVDFAFNMIFAIRTYSNLELDMNATERVIEYSELKTEDQGGQVPPAAWPTSGSMEVKNLVVAYADDLPPVLKSISFDVKNNERIGVVGRTGAGKSSLTLALFRFLEPRSGKVTIDGRDISKMDLYSLRSRLAIIPQDPVLFSGTVRSNLDPFDDHTDAELRDSLSRVHLLDSEPATPANESAQQPSSGEASAAASTAVAKNVNIFKDLSSPISESGGNLSQGQRQLLCLARAIVSRPRIMVLDEATSAVDMATDALIQRSIREEFTNSTLLVIAHRLSTIADFDRILVLSDGEVSQFGSPRELYQQEDGIFRDMCNKSGEKEQLVKTIFG